MSEPGPLEVRDRLAQSYALDRLWRETMGLPAGDTKEQPLRAVVAILEASGTPYALIGDLAVQLYSKEPRTTSTSTWPCDGSTRYRALRS